MSNKPNPAGSKTVIQTVNGDITPDKLGFCHSHEHLFISKGKSYEINNYLLIDDFIKTKDELKMYKDFGGRSIVDAQPVGCGRMAEQLVRASSETGVNIISSTGFHKLEYYDDDHWIKNSDESSIEKIFEDEILNGMYCDHDNLKPSIRIKNKAGVIKAAAGKDGITSSYEKLFNAAAKASLKTSAKIMCHTEMGAHAEDIADYLIDAGVRPESIILCHIDRVVDNIDVHMNVLKKGVYVEYDTIGRQKYHDDQYEAKLISEVISQGYEDRVLMGLDTTRQRLKSYGGTIGLDYILNVFIPFMKKDGIEMKYINKFMVENPAKAFSMNIDRLEG